MSEKPEYTVQRFRGGFALVHTPEGGTRQRRQLESTDRPSAEAEAREVWDGADESPLTVGRLVKAHLSAKKADGMITIGRREDAWKAMKPFWENVDPLRIDAQMCKDYRKTRAVEGTTVRLELSLLSSALGRAVNDKANPLTAKPEMWLPPAAERKTRHLTPSQFKKLLAGAIAPHARLYMLLGVFTIARPQALFDLCWTQVDFIRGTIDLNPPGRRQTAKRRPVVPMNGMLRKALAKAFTARTCTSVIERGGQPIASIKKAFKAAGERSGVHATPYTLRHTGAVWAAEQGTAMSELAQMMGHDDDRTTQKHYARYSPEHLRGVAQAVEDAFNSGAEVQTEPPAPVHRRA
jgi:integrase